jgi:hypothetical protein
MTDARQMRVVDLKARTLHTAQLDALRLRPITPFPEHEKRK